jgi:hypothetical protein
MFIVTIGVMERDWVCGESNRCLYTDRVWTVVSSNRCETSWHQLQLLFNLSGFPGSNLDLWILEDNLCGGQQQIQS